MSSSQEERKKEKHPKVSEGSLDPAIFNGIQRCPHLQDHQGPSCYTSGVRNRKAMLEQSNGHAKFSTAT